MGIFRMFRNLIRGHQSEPGEAPSLSAPAAPGALPTPILAPPPQLSALGDPPLSVKAPAPGQHEIDR